MGDKETQKDGDDSKSEGNSRNCRFLTKRKGQTIIDDLVDS